MILLDFIRRLMGLPEKPAGSHPLDFTAHTAAVPEAPYKIEPPAPEAKPAGDHVEATAPKTKEPKPRVKKIKEPK